MSSWPAAGRGTEPAASRPADAAARPSGARQNSVESRRALARQRPQAIHGRRSSAAQRPVVEVPAVFERRCSPPGRIAMRSAAAICSICALLTPCQARALFSSLVPSPLSVQRGVHHGCKGFRGAGYSPPPPRSRNTPIAPHSSGSAASRTIHTRATVSFPTAVNVGVIWLNQFQRNTMPKNRPRRRSARWRRRARA